MQLAHTMIRIRDLERSLEFYCGFLGLKEVRRSPIGDEATLVFLQDEAGRFRLINSSTLAMSLRPMESN